MKPISLSLRITLPALALLGLTACEGPNRKAMAEEVRHSIPTMAGHESFFGGDIVVDLQLGSDPDMVFGLRRQKEFPHSDKMLSGFGHNVLGSDMGERSFGGGSQNTGNASVLESDDKASTPGEEGVGRNTKGTYQGNRDMGNSGSEIPAPRQLEHDTEMPPATMRMRIGNPTEAVMVVEIKEVKSDLGNFAIRPDQVTLDPGKSEEVDPMVSMLGVDSFTLPVSVTLRAAGQTESKVIMLRVVPPKPGQPANPRPTPPSS